MSLLQTALHALPPGSVVTQGMMTANDELNDALARARAAEIIEAKRIQARYGCSWSDAIEMLKGVESV